MLQSIAYLSEATRSIVPEKLDALLVDARMFNASVDVTGVLLFHNGRFFQYFEGPIEGIKAVYSRVTRATSHSNIHELLNTNMPRRYFDTWHMGFCDAPETALQKLANANWEQSMPITRDEFEGFEGLGLAAYYWNKWCADSGDASLPTSTPEKKLNPSF